MGIRINWQPSPELDILSYKLERADNLTGAPWVFVAEVPHAIPGPNWDAVTSTFFYLDPAGALTNYYRLTAIDTVHQESIPSTPFQPVPTAPAFPNNVRVDHNYPTPGNLRYQTPGGLPIEMAQVRVYKKSDFDQGNTDTPLGVTLTNAQGNWQNPIILTTGYTYTVQFYKESLYGPDSTEIVV